MNKITHMTSMISILDIGIVPSLESHKRAMDDSVTTKLLTLLNVSATKVCKYKRTYQGHLGPSDKLNKRKTASFAEPRPEPNDIPAKTGVELAVVDAAVQEEVDVAHTKEDSSTCIQSAILVTLFDCLQSPMKSTLATTLSSLLTLQEMMWMDVYGCLPTKD